jgi:hypothetical protein
MAEKGTRNLGVGVKVDIGAVKAELEQLKSIIQSTAKGLSVSLTQVSRDQVSAASQASREMVAIQKAQVVQALAVNKSMTSGGNFNWLTGGMSPTDRSQMKGFYAEQSREIKNIANSHREAAEAAAYHNMNLRGIVTTGLRVYASYFMIKTVLESVVGSFFNYLSTIETASLGMSAAFMTGGEYIDKTTGKALKGSEALSAAMEDTKSVIKELQVANFETIATLDELVVAYQTTLPVALHKGFDKKMIMDFTLAMVQAAGAIGLPMNQMAEETRSLLMGTITPRNTRIGVILGITNADIRKYEGDTQGLFDFLMGKLAAFRIAGIEAQYTWRGLWSNTKDLVLMMGAQIFEPAFNAIKQSLMEIQKNILDVDSVTGKVKGFKPEFLESLRNVREWFAGIIADVRRFSMLLDKVGGSLTTIGYIGSLGMSSTMKEWNKMFEERYKANDKALMDMAMSEVGFKPATQEQLLPLEWATPQAAGLTAVKTELGQVLYYTKELNKENATFKAKKTVEDLGKLAEQWAKVKENLQLNIDELGLTDFEKKLVEIVHKAQEWNKQFEKVPGAKGFITQWGARMTIAATEAEREKLTKEANEKLLKLRTDYAKEEEKIQKYITESTGTELQKRITEEEKTAQDMVLVQNKYLIEGLIDLDIFLKKEEEIRGASGERIRKFREDSLKQEAEARIQWQLSQVDVMEKQHLVTKPEALKMRIEGTRELVKIQEEYLSSIDKLRDPAGWLAQAEAIEKSREKLLDFTEKFKEHIGSLQEGLREGMRRYVENATTAYQAGLAIVEATTASMKESFGSFFDYTSDKFLNFHDLAVNILHDIYMKAVEVSIIEPLITGLMGGVGGGGGLLSGLFGGLFRQQGGDVYAGTPYIVGERRPEVFIPNRNGTILPSIPGQSSVKVSLVVNNNTGTPVKARQQVTMPNPQEAVVTLFLDALDRDAYGLRSALGR